MSQQRALIIDMKQCPRCKENKPTQEFYSRGCSSWRCSSYCKVCQSSYSKTHYQRNKALHNRRRHANQTRYIQKNRAFIKDFLLCHPCGERDPAVLEFDHVSGTKEWVISDMVRCGYSLHRIKEEMVKCEIRCANCHRRKTARDFQWFKAGA